jgi:pimeloyl-ACP methyl ester carboxylesterase
MKFFYDRAPVDATDRVLLIMLPGVGIGAEAFAEQGMVAAVQALGAVDVLAVQPELELYLDGDMAAELHREVIALAGAQKRIWLLGISLGGMGALLFASAYPEHVEGVVLLAPFLGTKGFVAEVAKASGLMAWTPQNSMGTPMEQRVLTWLQDFLARQPARPKLYLGYGMEDRFAPGHRLLGDCLPADCVITAPGGHDWETWTALWRGVMARIDGIML